MPGNDERFITVCVDIDLAYKITNPLDYEASRFALIRRLEEVIGGRFFFWRTEGCGEECAFIIRTAKKDAVRTLKEILEHVKEDEKSPVVAAISKPYKTIAGIQRSFAEAQRLFGMASISGASAFTVSEEVSPAEDPALDMNGRADMDSLIAGAVRRNSKKERTEFMLQDTYGLTEDMKEKFRNYYYNLENLNAAKAVDVCYRILCDAVEAREKEAAEDETGYFREYISEAVAYIQEHLQEEDLSIVSVAAHIYLNPVYFGRVFKNTFHMTFKKYLMEKRMEKARELLESGSGSIGDICDAVGIHNPSYFSHLFKQYTGKLPSEYRKEYET